MTLIAALLAGGTVAALSPDPFTALIAALLGGGGVTAIAAIRKAGPEAENITGTTYRALIKTLNEEISRRDRAIADLHRREGEKDEQIADLRRRVGRLEDGDGRRGHS